MEETLAQLVIAVEALTKPTFFHWLTLFVSSVSVVFSGLAIYFAILVPKTLANQRNRISLFEKRYSLYLQLLDLHSCLDSLKALPEKQEIEVLVSALEQMKRENKDNSLFFHDMTTALNSPQYFFSFDISHPQYAAFRKGIQRVLQVLRGNDSPNPKEEITGIFENLDFFYETIRSFEHYFYICPPKTKQND